MYHFKIECFDWVSVQAKTPLFIVNSPLAWQLYIRLILGLIRFATEEMWLPLSLSLISGTIEHGGLALRKAN
jgi:hypothetical protein